VETSGHGFGAKALLLGVLLQVRVPPGVLLLPPSVSLTVAVQVVEPPAWNSVAVHVTVVVVVRLVTVTVVLALLVACFASPL
jgi:hypothetical protein